MVAQSAIGNYIHSSKKGFLEHGINMNRGKAALVIPRPYEGRIATIDSKILKEIADTYNEIQNPKPGEESAYNALANEVREKFDKIMQEKISEKIKGIDFNNCVVLVDEVYEKGLNVKKLSAHRADDKRLLLDIEETKDKLDQIQANMKQELLKRDATMSYQQIQRKIEQYRQEVQKLKNIYKRNSSTEASLLRQQAKSVKLRNEINEIITQFNSTPPKALWSGTAFEYIFGMLPYVAGKTASKSLEEYIKEAFDEGQVYKGGDKGIQIKPQFKKGSFYRAPAFSKTIGKLTLNANGNIERKQSKVDIQLNWDGNDIRISNKNYSIKENKTWIHVVSETPLLTLLLGLDFDFVNFFLNYASLHKDEDNRRKILTDKDLGEAGYPEQSTVYLAMKSILFYEGLTGDIFQNSNSDVVNVFAINNKLTGDMTLLSANDIVSQIEEKTRQISVTFNDKNIMEFRHFPNAYIGERNNWAEAAQRISYIVQELHQIKVSAKFLASSFI